MHFVAGIKIKESSILLNMGDAAITCIAVCKSKSGKLMMAGDRRLTMDWSLAMDMPAPKIKKFGVGVLVGAAGSGSLCTVLIDMLEFPIWEGENSDIYMQFRFRKALVTALTIAGYGDSNEMLMIPTEYSMAGLVVMDKKVYMVDVSNPNGTNPVSSPLAGLIEIEQAPLPYAVGCGASTAIPILLAEKKKIGYNTKEGLKLAMEIASDISPGCSNRIDIITD